MPHPRRSAMDAPARHPTCHLRPALLQPARGAIELTHSSPLRLPSILEVIVRPGKSPISVQYLGHGLHRIAYAEGEKRVMKIALPASGNEAEARVFELLAKRGLAPAPVAHGPAVYWSRDQTRLGDWTYLVVERVEQLFGAMLKRAPSSIELIFEGARCLAECASLGVLVSDCHADNLGWHKRRVVVIDTGDRLPVAHALSKRTINEKVMTKYWAKVSSLAEETAIDVVRRHWRDATDVQEFLAAPPLQLPASPPEPCPFASDESVESDDEEAANKMQPSKTASLVIVVTSGFYIDRIAFYLDGCCCCSMSGGSGGCSTTELRLLPEEDIVRVCLQTQHSDGVYLGRRFVVETTQRTHTFEGSHVGRPRQIVELEADVSKGRVVGLRFYQNQLVGFVYAQRALGPPVRPWNSVEPWPETVTNSDSHLTVSQEPEVLRPPPSETESTPGCHLTTLQEPKVQLSSETVFVTDSTLGFHLTTSQEPEILRPQPGVCVVCHNGKTFATLEPSVRLALMGRRVHRVYYVPMQKSLPPGKQQGYDWLDKPQRDAFEGTPFIRLPCIMDLEKEYEARAWSTHGDTCSALYSQKIKLHLRPKAAAFYLSWLVDHVERGSLVLIIGFNDKDGSDFHRQRDFCLSVLE